MNEIKPVMPINGLKMYFELGAFYKVYNDDSYEIFEFVGYEPPRGHVLGKGEMPLSQILSGFIYIEFLGHSLD